MSGKILDPLQFLPPPSNENPYRRLLQLADDRLARERDNVRAVFDAVALELAGRQDGTARAAILSGAWRLHPKFWMVERTMFDHCSREIRAAIEAAPLPDGWTDAAEVHRRVAELCVALSRLDQWFLSLPASVWRTGDPVDGAALYLHPLFERVRRARQDVEALVGPCPIQVDLPRVQKARPDPVPPIPVEVAQAKLSAEDLSRQFAVPLGALRKRLERWREDNDSGWAEVQNRVPRGPRYLYLVSAVLHIIADLRRTSD
jgi:hypothetical protein